MLDLLLSIIIASFSMIYLRFYNNQSTKGGGSLSITQPFFAIHINLLSSISHIGFVVATIEESVFNSSIVTPTILTAIIACQVLLYVIQLPFSNPRVERWFGFVLIHYLVFNCTYLLSNLDINSTCLITGLVGPILSCCFLLYLRSHKNKMYYKEGTIVPRDIDIRMMVSGEKDNRNVDSLSES